MNTLVFYRPAEPQRAEALMFASLGLAGLFCTLLATAAMLDFVAGSDQIAAALSPKPATVAASTLGSNATPASLKPARPRPPV